MNLVFFHSKQKPGACWQRNCILGIQRAGRPQGARGGSQHVERRLAFWFQNLGLFWEPGPVLISITYPGNKSEVMRGQPGGRSANVAQSWDLGRADRTQTPRHMAG